MTEPGDIGVLAGRLWGGLASGGGQHPGDGTGDILRGSQCVRGLPEKSGLAPVLSPGHRGRNKATFPGLLQPGLLESWRRLQN